MPKCKNYISGIVGRCLVTGRPIELKDSTMCRKNPEFCKHNKKQTNLGDYVGKSN